MNLSHRLFSKSKDYYKILGLKKSADQAEIKKAYVKLAKENHPDRNPSPNAKEKFSEISEAYQTLSDDKKRQVYDSYGIGADEQKQYENTGFGGAPDFGSFSDFFGGGRTSGFQGNFADFEDFFGMGGDSRGKRVSRGPDITLSLELDFFDAVNGISKDVSYRAMDLCGTCHGSKSKPGTSPTRCGSCGGKGVVTMRQGPMTIQIGCQACGGVGTVIKSPCGTCKGVGSVMQTMKEKITIPRGVNAGQVMRMSGKGGMGENGGPRGDLIIKVAIKPDKYFRREEYNVVTDLFLSVSQAVLGTEAEVRTLTGKRKVKVNAGTAHGSKIRLPGEGIQKLPPNDREKGDQYVVVNVTIPARLTNEQKALYEQLRSLEENKVEAEKKKSWF